jgi:hypothetical protein
VQFLFLIGQFLKIFSPETIWYLQTLLSNILQEDFLISSRLDKKHDHYKKISNPYRESSIDASYQVSVHLAKRFQRRRFLEINQLERRIA